MEDILILIGDKEVVLLSMLMQVRRKCMKVLSRANLKDTEMDIQFYPQK